MIVTSIMRKALLRAFLSLIAIACAGQAAAQAWTQLSPTGGPPAARYGHTSVYASTSNGMIAFGGFNTAVDFNDVWVLGHANGSGGTPAWTQLSPAGTPPATRTYHTAVYAPTSNRMIVFGGYDYGFATLFNDVWVLGNADGTGGTPAWTQLSPTGTPPAAREYSTAVYAAASDSMIVFGGFDGSNYLDDVWVLGYADGTGGTPAWTQLTPAGTPPPGRHYHSAVYDSTSNSMIVFGGVSGCPSVCSANNDVWVLSHADGSGGTPTWTQLSPSGGPPAARELHTAVYDDAGNHMVVFGGYDGSSSLNDVWVLSHANGSGGTPTWTQLSPTGGPPAGRYWHTAVYDVAGNNMIVFDGAGDSGVLNDVWVLGSASGVINIPVNIDIRPNTAVNTISRTNGTNIPVAILSSASFTAPTQVDKTSLTFGHSGSEASLIGCDLRTVDVNADGYKDLVCHFNGTLGGFQMGDTTGYLKGKTTVSNTISGSDTVTIIK